MNRADDLRAPGPADDRPRFRLTKADKVVAALLLFGLVGLFLWPFVVFAVRPGEVGVLYRLFTTGTVTTHFYEEGIGFKWPWNRIYFYEMRTQAVDEMVNGLAHDGLRVGVSITVLFRPVIENVGILHKTIGPDYVTRLVRPLSVAAVRNVIGKYDPHDLYRRDDNRLEAWITAELKDERDEALIEYQNVIVRNVVLPPVLDQAITRKLTEEQNTEAYEYLIAQAEQEAQRQRVQAIGIQTFYSIIADALSPQLLTWRGIEATIQIARSNNAKVVIVGGGKDQLPLILGSDIANMPALPTPPAVDPQSHSLPNFGELPMLFPTPGLQHSPPPRPLARPH